MDAIHDLDGNGNVLGIRHFSMEHDVVTAVLASTVRRRIVSDILQRTGNGLGPDGDVALKIRDDLTEQVLSRGDIRINR